MKEIGGFFELELNKGIGYHSGALQLNLGRTSFEYVLKARQVRRVFIPFFSCDAIIEPIVRTGGEPVYYHVNDKLEPVFTSIAPGHQDYFLYINYFGIRDKFINSLPDKVTNLIIDNSQAFFSMPLRGVDTFYSPRKFFGVPDGGYLYTDASLVEEFEVDNSTDRFGHLVGRIEEGAGRSYAHFRENEKILSGQPIKWMSQVTRRLLHNINYREVISIRKKNLFQLAEALGNKNLLEIDYHPGLVPMVYPFVSERTDLHNLLAGKKIFTATYWSDVLSRVSPDSPESQFVKRLIPLPLDQRYDHDDIEFIIKSVLKYV